MTFLGHLLIIERKQNQTKANVFPIKENYALLVELNNSQKYVLTNQMRTIDINLFNSII